SFPYSIVPCCIDPKEFSISNSAFKTSLGLNLAKFLRASILEVTSLAVKPVPSEVRTLLNRAIASCADVASVSPPYVVLPNKLTYESEDMPPTGYAFSILDKAIRSCNSLRKGPASNSFGERAEPVRFINLRGLRDCIFSNWRSWLGVSCVNPVTILLAAPIAPEALAWYSSNSFLYASLSPPVISEKYW